MWATREFRRAARLHGDTCKVVGIDSPQSPPLQSLLGAFLPPHLHLFSGSHLCFVFAGSKIPLHAVIKSVADLYGNRSATEWQARNTTATTLTSHECENGGRTRGYKLQAGTEQRSAFRRLLHTLSLKKWLQRSLRGEEAAFTPYLQIQHYCDFSRRDGVDQFQKVLH